MDLSIFMELRVVVDFGPCGFLVKRREWTAVIAAAATATLRRPGRPGRDGAMEIEDEEEGAWENRDLVELPYNS